MRALLLICLLTLVAKAAMLERTQVKMGTFATVWLEAKDISHAEALFEVFEEVENSLSSYRPATPIGRLNAFGFAKLDRHSQRALEISKTLYQKSGGYFDITVGTLTKGLYRFGAGEFLPHPSVRNRYVFSTQMLRLQEGYATLPKGIKVDLGGMGKGYGIDAAAEYLRAQGISHAIVALSGDIRCFGGCEIAVQDPYKEGVITTFSLRGEMGVSTSGGYNRYIKNQNNHHLINPKSKRSQKSFDSITLISHMPNALLDGYATALGAMPKERAFAFLEDFEGGYILIEHESQRVIVSPNIGLVVTNLLLR